MRLPLFILCLGFVLQACEGYKPQLRRATGESGEIAVFIPPKYRDQGIEDQIKDKLLRKFPGVFGDEMNFDLVFMDDENLDKATHRNLLEINIDPTNKHEVFVQKKALRALDQYQMVVFATDIESSLELIDTRANKIIASFEREDDNRYKRIMYQRVNPNFQNGIFDAQQISITIPTEYKQFIHNAKQFAGLRGWETKNGPNGKMLIQKFLYVMNYGITDKKNDLTKEFAVVRINQFLKEYTEYDNKNINRKAFFKISSEGATPLVVTRVDHRGNDALEIRGNIAVVDETGDAAPFGGYFVARVMQDIERGRMVVSLAAVNAPRDFGYREFLRKANEVVKSTKFN